MRSLHLDFTTADARVNSILWHEHDGKGNLNTHVIGENDPGFLEPHDWGEIDADGKLDIACGSEHGTCHW